QRAIRGAEEKNPLLLSDISLWEVATLQERGRIQLSLPLREWLDRAMALLNGERVGISPAIAAQVAALPDTFHRDPADRIIVASAMVRGATLITQDKLIIASRLVPTIA